MQYHMEVKTDLFAFREPPMVVLEYDAMSVWLRSSYAALNMGPRVFQRIRG